MTFYVLANKKSYLVYVWLQKIIFYYVRDSYSILNIPKNSVNFLIGTHDLIVKQRPKV